MMFKTLKEAVEYIRDYEENNTSGMEWNNDAGNWDLEDIEIASDEYYNNFGIHGYEVRGIYHDIYSTEGQTLFVRV